MGIFNYIMSDTLKSLSNFKGEFYWNSCLKGYKIGGDILPSLITSLKLDSWYMVFCNS